MRPLAQLEQLTEAQRTVHSMFWACLLAGEPCGTKYIAEQTGLSRGTVDNNLKRLRLLGLVPRRESHSRNIPEEWYTSDFMQRYPGGRLALGMEAEEPAFSVQPVPDKLPSAEELIERKKRGFERLAAHEDTKKLLNVHVNVEGPIGILHFGDPHIDDDGCDIHQLEHDVNLVRETEGLFGANVGDLQNAWVGRLGQLYGRQGTTQQEAWVLVEWLISSVPWLYIVGGNHDLFVGHGDPVQWIARFNNVVYEPHGVRIALNLPCGKQVRNNCRHDFPGGSQWNPVHGPLKAAMMGWRDHLLTCGHRHKSGYSITKDPSSGLISHCIMLAGYKRFDDYAKKNGFPDHNISGGAVTVIDPRFDETDPGFISVFMSTVQGARYLTYCRQQWKREQKRSKRHARDD